MLSSFRRKKGQAVTAEYVVLIALISVAITAMTVYVRRTLQARIGDADRYMITTAANASGINVLYEYEPYYKRQTSNTDAEKTTTYTTAGGGAAVTAVSQNRAAAEGDQKSPLQP